MLGREPARNRTRKPRPGLSRSPSYDPLSPLPVARAMASPPPWSLDNLWAPRGQP